MTQKNETPLSAADRRAIERMTRREERNRAPTIDPAVGVNRAKQEQGTLTAPTDVNNPGATATVNGQQVAGQESAKTVDSGLTAPQAATLPEGLTPQAVKSLETEGIMTLADSLKYTDAQLNNVPGVGDATIKTLRDAATAAGLTWAQPEQTQD